MLAHRGLDRCSDIVYENARFSGYQSSWRHHRVDPSCTPSLPLRQYLNQCTFSHCSTGQPVRCEDDARTGNRCLQKWLGVVGRQRTCRP